MSNDNKNTRKKKLKIDELNIEELEGVTGGIGDAPLPADPVTNPIGKPGVVRPNTGQPLPILFS